MRPSPQDAAGYAITTKRPRDPAAFFTSPIDNEPVSGTIANRRASSTWRPRARRTNAPTRGMSIWVMSSLMFLQSGKLLVESRQRSQGEGEPLFLAIQVETPLTVFLVLLQPPFATQATAEDLANQLDTADRVHRPSPRWTTRHNVTQAR